MKITDLIIKLQVLAAVNPNLIIVARVHSDYRIIDEPNIQEMALMGDTWYTVWTDGASTDKISKVVTIEGKY